MFRPSHSMALRVPYWGGLSVNLFLVNLSYIDDEEKKKSCECLKIANKYESTDYLLLFSCPEMILRGCHSHLLYTTFEKKTGNQSWNLK